MNLLRVLGWICALVMLAQSQVVAQETGASDYQIYALRYGTIPQFPTAVLAQGVDPDERLDIALVFWVIKNADRVVLFDSGFHRARWFEAFTVTDYLQPDQVLNLIDLQADQVTDLIISHAHWDHMGGIDLFPNARLWIQADEYAHYTGQAWQNGGNGGGADPADLQELLKRNTSGLLSLVDGDDIEILPGIRVYTGARHTYASQYIRVDGEMPIVLASDNGYLYRNYTEERPVATFTPQDREANLRALKRMLELAGSLEQIVPGHDPEQFTRFELVNGTEGRVARIR